MIEPKNISQEKQIQSAFNESRKKISCGCTNCGLCQKECPFLQQYGSPKEISDAPNLTENKELAFACNLCELCTAVCPEGLNPAELFLLMRQNANAKGAGKDPKHRRMLQYEKTGISNRFSLAALPKGCDTVLFPGCTLPGTRPKTTLKLFEHLGQQIKALGIVLDCCSKPSHDLGHTTNFQSAFYELKAMLISSGITTVLTACPNCYKQFKTYGAPLNVTTVYEALEDAPLNHETEAYPTTIHDSCAVRFDDNIHKSVRRLLRRLKFSVVEMPHHTKKTLCCGEGGSTRWLSPELANQSLIARKQEAGNLPLITYCAGCAGYLSRVTPTVHLLDLIFSSSKKGVKKPSIAKAPFTYLHRLLLKRKIKHLLPGAFIAERPYLHTEG
jgi:Fe-S oxidoreductase